MQSIQSIKIGGEEMEIEIWETAKLKSGENQAAVGGLDKLARQIDELGFNVPVIAKMSGEVIFGHKQIEASRAIGLEQVPVIPADELDADQLRSFSFFFEIITGGQSLLQA
jgi:hypothetical protein